MFVKTKHSVFKEPPANFLGIIFISKKYKIFSIFKKILSICLITYLDGWSSGEIIRLC